MEQAQCAQCESIQDGKQELVIHVKHIDIGLSAARNMRTASWNLHRTRQLPQQPVVCPSQSAFGTQFCSGSKLLSFIFILRFEIKVH